MIRLLLILTLLATSLPAQAFDVTFKKNATVDDALVTLGDVASISEISEIGKSLLTIPVANSPAPGEKAFLGSVDIKRYLSSSQTLPDNIQWKGSSTVTVTRGGITINAQKMLGFISDYLRSREDSLPPAVIRFIPTSHPLPFTLPTGELSCDVIPSNPGVLSSSRFSLIFRVNDKVVKTGSVYSNMIPIPSELG